MHGSATWLLLTYKVPRQPSAARVYVWRKLRRLGAMLVHDSIWVLPASDRTAEQFRWLSEEVKELGGNASIWTAQSASQAQEAAMIQAFSAHVDRAYQSILVELKAGKSGVSALSRRYQEVLARDYFRSPLGMKVRKALMNVRGGGRQ